MDGNSERKFVQERCNNACRRKKKLKRAILMFESEYLWQKLLGRFIVVRIFKAMLVAIRILKG